MNVYIVRIEEGYDSGVLGVYETEATAIVAKNWHVENVVDHADDEAYDIESDELSYERSNGDQDDWLTITVEEHRVIS